MELGQVQQQAQEQSKEFAAVAVDFGGGEWDFMAVEVDDMQESEAAEENKWVVVKSKKAKGWKKIKDTLKVVGMEENKMQLEVNEPTEKFIGNVEKGTQVMSMMFQAAGVKKALSAVSKICKAGNLVQVGDEPGDCYIKNKTTGKKVMLEKRRGSYVMKVEFVYQAKNAGGQVEWKKMTEEVITVDSGAEESVCPLVWGREFGLTKVQPGMEMKMVNAAGGEMPHYGARKVFFKAAGF